MLNIGIIGNKNLEHYVNAINKLPFFQLKAIFDPSYQIENNTSPYKSITENSINDLFLKCDTVIFSSANRLYFNLIKSAIKNGKTIFLHSTSNFTLDEHKTLSKLADEAKETIQIFHPYLYSKPFTEFNEKPNKPILYRLINSGICKNSLMQDLRHDISALLSAIKSPVKQVSVLSHAILNDFPDTYSVNITFDNASTANFIADTIDSERKHQIRTYLQNNLKQINLHDYNKDFAKQLQEQLDIFYNNILCAKSPQHDIENELRTQYLIEKIKDKIRFSFNIV